MTVAGVNCRPVCRTSERNERAEMMHSNSPSDRARAVFVARKEELDSLLDAYKDVRAGSGPRMLALLGESGVGKTRLVQEFFGKLSTQYDKAGADGF